MAKNKYLKEDRDDIEESWQYYWGDHLDFWIGVRPDKSTEEGRIMQDDIERMFQEINIINEVVNRHINALLAQEPIAYLSDSDAKNTEAELKASNDEFNRILRQSLENPVGESIFPDVMYEALITLLIEGRSYLRVTTISDGSTWLHCPDSESVEVLKRDEVGRLLKVAYNYTEENEQGDLESWKELQYFDEVGRTVFEYYRGDSDLPERVFSLDLGHKFTIVEARRKPYISMSMKRSQGALNHAATLLPRNNQISGFVSRIIINAKVPGTFRNNEEGEKVFQPDPDAIVVAPGMMNFIAGIPIRDENGQVTGYTTPEIHSEQPIEVKTFIESANFAVSNIYSQANQGHLLANDLVISGRSRVELRNDFTIALNRDAKQLQDFYGKALYVALLVNAYRKNASNIANLLALNPVVIMRPNPGQPSAEERREIRETFAARLISRKTAISALGYVDDADAEIERIKEDSVTQVNTQDSDDN